MQNYQPPIQSIVYIRINIFQSEEGMIYSIVTVYHSARSLITHYRLHV